MHSSDCLLCLLFSGFITESFHIIIEFYNYFSCTLLLWREIRAALVVNSMFSVWCLKMQYLGTQGFVLFSPQSKLIRHCVILIRRTSVEWNTFTNTQSHKLKCFPDLSVRQSACRFRLITFIFIYAGNATETSCLSAWPWNLRSLIWSDEETAEAMKHFSTGVVCVHV